MKKLFTLAVMLLATVWTSLNAADKQNILNKINSLPMPFTAGTVAESGYTVQKPYFWQFKVEKDIYHAAIIFEDYPDGAYSDSQRFLSLFMVWKNGKIYYRRVIENDPDHIRITNCKIEPDSAGKIYLVLNYNFKPYYEDTFTGIDGKCSVNLPALLLAFLKPGSRSPAKIARIATTTRNSINVSFFFIDVPHL